MANEVSDNRWTEKSWLDQAYAWIEDRLAERNIRVAGAITQPHVRPWATALRIPTDAGPLWFKATVPVLGHESALTQALSGWSSGRTPNVLAADHSRNWLLMSDGGRQLRSLLRTPESAPGLAGVAAQYAVLQRDLSERLAPLLALQVPDCRLARLPALYEALLGDSDAMMVGREDGVTSDQLARLRELVPFVASICDELGAVGIPETLQHDDLHSNNVLVNDGRLIFFDWGDSCVSHPFLSLVIILRSAARDLQAAEDSPAVLQVQNAFVDAWDIGLTAADRDRACLLADALGRISRALNWSRLHPGLDVAAQAEYAPMVAAWLQEFLDAPLMKA